MKFKTVADIEQVFLSESKGADVLRVPQTGLEYSARLSDIQGPLKEAAEYLLSADYNIHTGWGFSEIMEALSLVARETPSKYLSDCSAHKGTINENFYGTTQALQQFPIMNKQITLYQYDSTVLPNLAHMFSLNSNRALVPYMTLRATNDQGDVLKDDVIASPRDFSKQTTNFVGTRMEQIEVGVTVIAEDTIDIIIPNAPILPQSLTINVEGYTGIYLKDESTSVSGITYLLNINGKIGECQIDLNTGLGTLVLATAATASGLKVLANYNRDVQTLEGGTNNQARVTPVLETVLLQAEDFSVHAPLTLHNEVLAQNFLGINMSDQLDDMLFAIYNREVANKLVASISNKIPVGSVGEYNIEPNVNTGDNRAWTTAFFQTQIGRIKQMIAKASGIPNARLTTLVANVDVIPVLEYSEKFKSVEAGENFMGGMAIVGTWDGMPVIQAYDPIVPSGQIIGIYKSKKNPFLTPAVFGSFILPIVREVFDPNNLSIKRKQMISSAGYDVVCKNLASKINIVGLDTIGLLG